MDDRTPDLTPDDPDIPSAPPLAESGEPEVEDQPLGGDPDEDADPDAQPGIPTEGEPPASE